MESRPEADVVDDTDEETTVRLPPLKSCNDVYRELQGNKKFTYLMAYSGTMEKKVESRRGRSRTVSSAGRDSSGDLLKVGSLNPLQGSSASIATQGNEGDIYKLKGNNLMLRDTRVHTNASQAALDNAYFTGTPRSSYFNKKQFEAELMSKLMLDMEATKIESIKRYFDADNDVDMDEFIRIMRAHLDRHITRTVKNKDRLAGLDAAGRFTKSGKKTGGDDTDGTADVEKTHGLTCSEEQLVSSLIELFREIDVNGDGTMEWDEFTRYLAEKALVSQQNLSLVKQTQEFFPVSSLYGKKHNNYIDKVFSIPSREEIVVLEQKSPHIRIYSNKDLSLTTTLTEYKGLPAAVEYIPSCQYLVTSCYNSRMCLWNLSSGLGKNRLAISDDKIHRAIWPTPHVQTALIWSNHHRRLYSGSTTGLLHIWDPFKRSEISFKPGHTDVVTSLTLLESLDCFASSSMDGTVSLFDMYSMVQRQRYVGHKKGILGLSYCPDLKLLISAGFDRDGFIWSPFVGGLISKLKGHISPLVGVEAMPGTTQVITADTEGFFKLWDLRNYKCIQTFTRERTKGITSFAWIPKKERIVCGVKSLRFFEQGQDKSISTVSDMRPCTCLLYNSTSLTIATAHGRDLKIWSALSGLLLREYKNMTESDISCMCLDDRERKLIVGEHSGKIGAFNYINGYLMKEFVPHDGEVVGVAYIPQLKGVVSCGWDRYVPLHDESDPEKGAIVRVMDTEFAHKDEITTMAVSTQTHLVATGSADCTFRVWDYETGKNFSVLEHAHQICCITFIDEVNCIMVSDTSGLLKLWGTKYSHWPDQCIFTARHLRAIKGEEMGSDGLLVINTTETQPTKPSFSVTSATTMIWNAGRKTLFTADERGYVQSWSLERIIGNLTDPTILTSKKLPHITESMMKLTWELDAHADSITCMKYVPQPEVLITSGFDRKVHVWNMLGQRLGSLAQGNSGSSWDLPVEISGLLKQDSIRLKEALEKYKKAPKCELLFEQTAEDEKMLPNIKSLWLMDSSPAIASIEELRAKALLNLRQRRNNAVNKEINTRTKVHVATTQKEVNDPLNSILGQLRLSASLRMPEEDLVKSPKSVCSTKTDNSPIKNVPGK